MVLKKLEKIRKESGKTFQDVADQAGLTKEFYWMIEKGKRKLSYENAVRIALVFGKEPDDIFLESELTKTEQKRVVEVIK
ncbi:MULTISPECIES: helix-turn-helix transcriptional regulator [unclassified Enterococcus]|uniref:helix-turn-helix transcriptional regulator n=1 Tax=unclassified Enterococcus TaxID=2608891 RepID=UPI0028FDB98D|nr:MULTISPECIES: helix-turn-helix transcriptional regulator [unclassified Enterococcus]MDU0318999.1 helix-turn-helix transcriptional regulator [Enterococcus sp. 2STP]MDU0334489.1 helix-turn-helix transcriptional regulator [Enterococcus sp. 2CBP]MDU0350258.1 helix-turn-helix transcriptional regulator [Enterococcus sp. 3MOLP]